MKNIFATLISAGVLFSAGLATASSGTHCIRGGGVNVNLPSSSYHLYMQEDQNSVIELAIFERGTDPKNRNAVLEASVELVRVDQKTLRSIYESRDGRITLMINQNADGEVLSAFISGTGEGLDQRKTFAFEGRSCGQVD